LSVAWSDKHAMTIVGAMGKELCVSEDIGENALLLVQRDPRDLTAHPATAGIPRLSKEQCAALVRSIQETGFDPRFPLLITPGNQILDGLA
jgi:hypothetical protein